MRTYIKRAFLVSMLKKYETNSMAKSPAAQYLRTDYAPQASLMFVGILFSAHNRINLI